MARGALRLQVGIVLLGVIAIIVVDVLIVGKSSTDGSKHAADTPSTAPVISGPQSPQSAPATGSGPQQNMMLGARFENTIKDCRWPQHYRGRDSQLVRLRRVRVWP
jgi:hypothetical protein